MKDEIDLSYKQEYFKTCACGKEHTIISQTYGDPEYLTDVWLFCECGKIIHFVLPVN